MSSLYGEQKKTKNQSSVSVNATLTINLSCTIVDIYHKKDYKD